jgi:hypothetical protein
VRAELELSAVAVMVPLYVRVGGASAVAGELSAAVVTAVALLSQSVCWHGSGPSCKRPRRAASLCVCARCAYVPRVLTRGDRSQAPW